MLHFSIEATAQVLERDPQVLAMMAVEPRALLDSNNTDALLRFVMQGDGMPPRTAARLNDAYRAGYPGVRGRCVFDDSLRARVVSWLGSEFAQTQWSAGLAYRAQGTDMAFAAFLATGCGAVPGACPGYPPGALIMGVSMTPFALSHALSPEMRWPVPTRLRVDLTALCTFFAQAATLPQQRESMWMFDRVSGS